MMKRILLIFIVLALAGGGVYYYLNSQETIETPQVEAKTAKALTEEAALSPVASFNNNSLWYGQTDGRIMRYDLNTNLETEYPVDHPPGQVFNKILWPISGSDYIFEGTLDGQHVYNYYNSATKKYITLPKNVINLDWLNDSHRVVYTWKASDGAIQLITANSDGTGYKKVADLPWSDIIPKASPVNNTALLVRPYAEGEINKIYLFDLETGKYSDLIATGRNTAALWSPKGDKFAYTQTIDGQSELFISGLDPQTSVDLNVTALISQIYFSPDGLYLYVASDKFYKINLETNEQTVVFDPNKQMEVRSLLVIGQKIFFTDPLGKLNVIE